MCVHKEEGVFVCVGGVCVLGDGMVSRKKKGWSMWCACKYNAHVCVFKNHIHFLS